MISPKMFIWEGSRYILLGVDCDGKKRFLQGASWDCGWYWGFGYVETFSNNSRPELSADVERHEHFDSMFFSGDGYTRFFKMFEDRTPMDEGVKWKFLELMKSFYIARAYSDMLHRGGAGYSKNLVGGVISDDYEYRRINTEVIPSIVRSVYGLLGFPDEYIEDPHLDDDSRPNLRELFT